MCVILYQSIHVEVKMKYSAAAELNHGCLFAGIRYSVFIGARYVDTHFTQMTDSNPNFAQFTQWARPSCDKCAKLMRYSYQKIYTNPYFFYTSLTLEL